MGPCGSAAIASTRISSTNTTIGTTTATASGSTTRPPSTTQWLLLVRSDQFVLFRPTQQEQFLLQLRQYRGSLSHQSFQGHDILTQDDLLDGLGVDVPKVGIDFAAGPQMPGNVGDEHRSQMGFSGQQVGVSNAVEGFVFLEQFADHNGREQVGRKAVHPQPGTPATDIGHGKAQKVRKEQTADVIFEVLGIGVAAPGKIEGQEDDKGKDGHFDNAPQGQSVEAQKDETVVSDPVNDFLIAQQKTNLDPFQIAIDREGRWDQFGQSVSPGTAKEWRSLLVVVKAAHENAKQTKQEGKEHDERGKTHARFLKGAHIFHVIR